MFAITFEYVPAEAMLDEIGDVFADSVPDYLGQKCVNRQKEAGKCLANS